MNASDVTTIADYVDYVVLGLLVFLAAFIWIRWSEIEQSSITLIFISLIIFVALQSVGNTYLPAQDDALVHGISLLVELAASIGIVVCLTHDGTKIVSLLLVMGSAAYVVYKLLKDSVAATTVTLVVLFLISIMLALAARHKIKYVLYCIFMSALSTGVLVYGIYFLLKRHPMDAGEIASDASSITSTCFEDSDCRIHILFWAIFTATRLIIQACCFRRMQLQPPSDEVRAANTTWRKFCGCGERAAEELRPDVAAVGSKKKKKKKKSQSKQGEDLEGLAKLIDESVQKALQRAEQKDDVPPPPPPPSDGDLGT